MRENAKSSERKSVGFGRSALERERARARIDAFRD